MQTDLARLFELSQVTNEKPKERFLPRFGQLVFIIQIPRLDLMEAVEKMKGSALTDEDKKEVELRVEYAKKWIQTYAPDKYRYELQETLPKAAKDLTDVQKKFVDGLAKELDGLSKWEGEDIHSHIHGLVKANEEFTPKDCFQALYKLFLGKDFGPQAGWFLSALDKEFVVKRLEEVL